MSSRDFLRLVRGVQALAVTGVVVTVTVVGVQQFGTERSVENYCRTFWTEGAEVRQRYINAGNSAEQDPLGSVAVLLGLNSDMAILFDKLAKVAPDEIEPDVTTAAKNFHKQADQQGEQAAGLFSNPVGTIFGGVVQGIADSPPLERVDEYTTKNCGSRPPA